MNLSVLSRLCHSEQHRRRDRPLREAHIPSRRRPALRSPISLRIYRMRPNEASRCHLLAALFDRRRQQAAEPRPIVSTGCDARRTKTAAEAARRCIHIRLQYQRRPRRARQLEKPNQSGFWWAVHHTVWPSCKDDFCPAPCQWLPLVRPRGLPVVGSIRTNQCSECRGGLPRHTYSPASFLPLCIILVPFCLWGQVTTAGIRYVQCFR